MPATYEIMEPTTATKSCPRCGATLFADMDVCYGCLYDFSTSPYEPQDIPHSTHAGGRPSIDSDSKIIGDFHTDTMPKLTTNHEPSSCPDKVASPTNLHSKAQPDSPADADFSFDDLWTEEDNQQFMSSAGWTPLTSQPAGAAVQDRTSSPKQVSSSPASDCREEHGQATLSPDETVDLGAVVALLQLPKLKVEIGGCAVNLEVPEHPLVVGRHPSCDIVVSDPTVSRKQFQICRVGNAVYVDDLGATNPTLINGAPLLMRTQLGAGSSFHVGEACFSIVQTVTN